MHHRGLGIGQVTSCLHTAIIDSSQTTRLLILATFFSFVCLVFLISSYVVCSEFTFVVEVEVILLMSLCVFVFQCYRRVTDEINLEGICSMFESGETDIWPPLPCFCNFVWFVRVAETEAFCVVRG